MLTVDNLQRITEIQETLKGVNGNHPLADELEWALHIIKDMETHNRALHRALIPFTAVTCHLIFPHDGRMPCAYCEAREIIQTVDNLQVSRRSNTMSSKEQPI